MAESSTKIEAVLLSTKIVAPLLVSTPATFDTTPCQYLLQFGTLPREALYSLRMGK
jgi:hypothetical protein